jgi:hypothetical protein
MMPIVACAHAIVVIPMATNAKTTSVCFLLTISLVPSLVFIDY